MKVKVFIGMVNALKVRLNNFDVAALQEKRKNGSINHDDIQNLIDDVYKLEGDLIILNCEKKRTLTNNQQEQHETR